VQPRFRFRLDPVLDLRTRVEERKQLAVSAAERALRDEQVRLDALGAEYAETSRRVREQHRALDGQGLYAAYVRIEFVSRQMTLQHEAIKRAGATLARARAELLAASRDRKAIETLKTRKREAYDLSLRQREQHELDEANLRRVGSSSSRDGM
jgi:flagellar protein FliJ